VGTRGRLGAVWPLFDLAVRTPRLELRLPREDEFPDLVALADDGIHDPGTMPFFVPWTDLEPGRRARESAQWFWGQRANWSPDKWTFTGAVFVGETVVGVQDVFAERFRAVRSVETGSWLGRAHQGQGLGREMREAVLHLAFAGLGAEEALSGAFEDNAASLATSRAIGYAENGEARGPRRDGSARTIRFRLDRAAWERLRRDDIQIDGLEGCLELFVGTVPAGESATPPTP
jgi:RimJ/RimL family protein N-acetyltransferase